MNVTQADINVLFAMNPVAQAQMEAITALRLGREKDEEIKGLKARLELAEKAEPVEDEMTVKITEDED